MYANLKGIFDPEYCLIHFENEHKSFAHDYVRTYYKNSNIDFNRYMSWVHNIKLSAAIINRQGTLHKNHVSFKNNYHRKTYASTRIGNLFKNII